jgi:hypothetical protein
VRGLAVAHRRGDTDATHHHTTTPPTHDYEHEAAATTYLTNSIHVIRTTDHPHDHGRSPRRGLKSHIHRHARSAGLLGLTRNELLEGHYMSGITNGVDQQTHATKVGHLAVVETAAAVSTTSNTTTTRTRASGGASFGAPIERAAGARHAAGVRAIATQYPNFEEALLPMVLASGVGGDAAVAVADAIMNNPNLRAQAERAFQRARLTAV